MVTRPLFFHINNFKNFARKLLETMKRFKLSYETSNCSKTLLTFGQLYRNFKLSQFTQSSFVKNLNKTTVWMQQTSFEGAKFMPRKIPCCKKVADLKLTQGGVTFLDMAISDVVQKWHIEGTG
eukprot:TRINITY_DN6923_c1_g1_i1.p2 TRINITY_DN6923_c1_g1~~TRINITY_DN6923_c1_g1_i1.p2  ORF type:complete len:123 (-),score=1.31 TRINITY_DN6923_c1_g1_i1:58-426(-)